MAEDLKGFSGVSIEPEVVTEFGKLIFSLDQSFEVAVNKAEKINIPPPLASTWSEVPEISATDKLKSLAFLQTPELPSYLCNPLTGGPMKFNSPLPGMAQYSDVIEKDMPEYLKEAIEKAGCNPWAFYEDRGAIGYLAQAENGARMVVTRDRGQFGGFKWKSPPIGQITLNPELGDLSKEMLAYRQERLAGWQKETAELPKNPDAGEAESSLHPYLQLEKLKRNIEEDKRSKELKAEKDRRRLEEQKALNEQFEKQGYFRGRCGRAELPDGSVIVESAASGDRNDPVLIAISPKIAMDMENFGKLVGLVAYGSQVTISGDNIKVRISSEELREPERYKKRLIGYQGQTVRALEGSLGLSLGRRIRIRIE